MGAGNGSSRRTLTVGLAGFGNVGRSIAKRLNGGEIPGIRLTAVSAQDLDAASARAESIGLDPMPVFVSATQLPVHADVIVECATFDAFPEIVRAAVSAGKTVICVSVGALGANLDLIDLAENSGGRIVVANGAMPGLDEIRCAREGAIHSVVLTSRIRPDSLAHEAHVLSQGFDFTNRPPEKPVRVFSGTAREAAAAFPRHFNVAVSLSLAGIGLDRTRIEVWADADIPGAIHHVEVEADDVSLSLEARNRPSPDNNRTSRIVAPSIMAALRSMVSPIQLGS